jgi:hypothetical protein
MRPQGSRVPSGDSQRPVTALPWLRSVPGGLLPLVGRTEELAVVTEALTHAAHGQGRSILITGPAGREIATLGRGCGTGTGPGSTGHHSDRGTGSEQPTP